MFLIFINGNINIELLYGSIFYRKERIKCTNNFLSIYQFYYLLLVWSRAAYSLKVIIFVFEDLFQLPPELQISVQ